MMNFSTICLMSAISELVNSNVDYYSGVVSDEEFAVVIATANVNANEHEDFERISKAEETLRKFHAETRIDLDHIDRVIYKYCTAVATIREYNAYREDLLRSYAFANTEKLYLPQKFNETIDIVLRAMGVKHV